MSKNFERYPKKKKKTEVVENLRKSTFEKIRIKERWKLKVFAKELRVFLFFTWRESERKCYKVIEFQRDNLKKIK